MIVYLILLYRIRFTLKLICKMFILKEILAITCFKDVKADVLKDCEFTLSSKANKYQHAYQKNCEI